MGAATLMKVTTKLELVTVAELVSVTVVPDTAATVVSDEIPVEAETVAPTVIEDAIVVEATVTVGMPNIDDTVVMTVWSIV